MIKLTARLFFVVLLAAQDVTAHSGSVEQVSIYRDQYHTPHIVAQSNRGVFYGYGYAVASDRLFQMEMLKRPTEGRPWMYISAPAMITAQ